MSDPWLHPPFDFRMPGSLRMGWGARTLVGEILGQKNVHRVALVTDPGLAQAGLVDEIRRHLGPIEVAVFARVSPDPPIEDALAAAEHVRASGADAVIGLGGGSSLDVAKLAAVLAVYEVPLESLIGVDKVPGRGLPTLLMPTTAGTGSEVSPIAILSDTRAHLKKGIVSPHLYADVAVVDPELTCSMPPAVTASTGLDALTHCIEAYTNRFALPLTDAFAMEGIRLISRHLLRAVQNGSDRQARYAMSLGSLFGGLILGTVNTGAAHALAYPLGGLFRVPHGVANALLLPHVMRFNLPAAAARLAAVAEAMGRPVAGRSELQAAEAAVAAVDELSAQAGVVRRLRDLDIPASALKPMAAAAMQVTRLLRLNPREVTEADALAIYQAAY